jgi:hypothetical protein
MSKLYRSKHEGFVSFGNANIQLTEGQEFDEGSDIVLAHPEYFEEAGEKPQLSEKVVDGATVAINGEPVDPEDPEILEKDGVTAVAPGLTTDSVPSRTTKSKTTTDTNTSK